jgi:hypothetical protein
MEAPDKYVERNREQLLQRSLLGVSKYGTTIENSPQRSPEWAQHAIEGALDLANYLQAMKDQCTLDHDSFIALEGFLLALRKDFGNLCTTTEQGVYTRLDEAIQLVSLRINKDISNG